MPSRTFCQSLYKTAKSRFMVQCVNVCLALINVHVLKALQRHDNLRMLNTKNERVLPQMRVVCDPPLLLLCSVRRLEQNKWQRSSRAKSRAVEVSGEHIEKRGKGMSLLSRCYCVSTNTVKKFRILQIQQNAAFSGMIHHRPMRLTSRSTA